jgi:hypothetical protein
VGNEDLRAVEEVVIALVDGRGGGAAGIAPRARLGEPEAAEYAPGREQGHIAPLLLLGAELDDRRGAEVGMGADGERVARVHLGHLVDGDVIGELVHAGAAELLAPGHAQQAQLAHRLDVVPGKGGRAVQLPGDRSDPRPRELADHLSDLVMVLG